MVKLTKVVVYQDGQIEGWLVERWEGPKLVNQIRTSTLIAVHKLLSAHFDGLEQSNE